MSQPKHYKTTNVLGLDPWVSDDEDSDTVTSKSSYDESSQETDTNPSVTPCMVPNQDTNEVPTMVPNTNDPRWTPSTKSIPKSGRRKL